MLIVRVELWPFGGAEKQELAIMRIYNDDTGDLQHGNYVAQKLHRHAEGHVPPYEVDSSATVAGHNRSDPVWELVRKALNAKWVASHPLTE